MVWMRCVLCKGIFEGTHTLRHARETGHNTWTIYKDDKTVKEKCYARWTRFIKRIGFRNPH